MCTVPCSQSDQAAARILCTETESDCRVQMLMRTAQSSPPCTAPGLPSNRCSAGPLENIHNNDKIKSTCRRAPAVGRCPVTCRAMLTACGARGVTSRCRPAAVGARQQTRLSRPAHAAAISIEPGYLQRHSSVLPLCHAGAAIPPCSGSTAYSIATELREPAGKKLCVVVSIADDSSISSPHCSPAD